MKRITGNWLRKMDLKETVANTFSKLESMLVHKGYKFCLQDNLCTKDPSQFFAVNTIRNYDGQSLMDRNTLLNLECCIHSGEYITGEKVGDDNKEKFKERLLKETNIRRKIVEDMSKSRPDFIRKINKFAYRVYDTPESCGDFAVPGQNAIHPDAVELIYRDKASSIHFTIASKGFWKPKEIDNDFDGLADKLTDASKLVITVKAYAKEKEEEAIIEKEIQQTYRKFRRESY